MYQEGNLFSHLALLVWIPLMVLLGNSLGPRRAALASIIGGTLFLPQTVAFDLPALPAFDKNVVASVGALAACLVSDAKSVLGAQSSRAARNLLVLMAVSILATTYANPDAVRWGPLVMPGMTLYDAVSAFLRVALSVVLPFFLGQTLCRDEQGLRETLRALVLAAWIYVPFIFLEARLSPFFHERIYGFFQHDFVQAMRNGGFRAFVFMSHGLAVAFFVSQALTGVAGLSRLRDAALPLPHKLSLLVLGVALVTCKSVGAMLYAIVTVPLTLLASAKAQARVAGWLALAVISYPMLRVFDWISLDWFLEQAQRVGADRAQSLEFRFVNESALLARAQERPLLGWGTWGRNLIFDPFSGRDLSVIDGEWILQLGSFGILGYLISFGLLLWPVWAVARLARRRDLAPSLQQALATFSLMLAFLGLDLIPNSISHGIPFWMAGALTATTAPLLRQRATT